MATISSMSEEIFLIDIVPKSVHKTQTNQTKPAHSRQSQTNPKPPTNRVNCGKVSKYPGL